MLAFITINYGENLRKTKNFCWWAREREKISHEGTKICWARC